MIRSVWVFFLSFLMAGTVQSEMRNQTIETCTNFSLIAKNIMMARQQDRPMSEVLPDAIAQFSTWIEKYGFGLVLANLQEEDRAALEEVLAELPEEMVAEAGEEMAARMVILAYDKSIGSSEHFQQLNITEFENRAFRECYESSKPDSDEE